MTETEDAKAKWDENDLLAATSLAALPGPYVPWSARSMRPSAVATIVNHIVINRPATIVEFGTGASTVFFSRAAAHTGSRLISFEDDAGWAQAFSELVRGGEVVHCPLVPMGRPIEALRGGDLVAPVRWYDLKVVLAALPGPIDLLVVDGPSAGADSGLVRAPAVPLLGDRLAVGYTIVLNDANRPAELEAARLWQRQLDAQLSLQPRTGLAVLRDEDAIFPGL